MCGSCESTSDNADQRQRVDLFDAWAETYNRAVDSASFPLAGYDEALNAIIRLARTS